MTTPNTTDPLDLRTFLAYREALTPLLERLQAGDTSALPEAYTLLAAEAAAYQRRVAALDVLGSGCVDGW